MSSHSGVSSLHLERLAFAYDGGEALFSDVSLTLTPGWWGLVGANGAGKSTLLSLIAGERAPSQGRIWPRPEVTSTVLCPQRVDEPDARILDCAQDWSRAAMRWRARLGVEPEQLDRWDLLSPGVRKRWQIAAALLARPEVLLLDEPSNHLDAEARRCLVEALEGFDGVGILVSHDRGLLDALTTRTLRLAGGALTSWPGGYSRARPHWQAHAQAEQARLTSAQAGLRAAEHAARQISGRMTEGEQRARRQRRRAGHRDHDATSAAARVRADAGQARASQSARVARQEVERQRAQVDRMMRPDKSFGRAVEVSGERGPRTVVASLENVRCPPLDGPVRCTLERDAQVWLTGGNGVGKTRLLSALVHACTLPTDRLQVVPQLISGPRIAARLDALRDLGPSERASVLHRVAALGVDPARLLGARHPSPGEARVLELAWGLGRPIWWLVLDEPTNHLALPTVERLQTALEGFAGALLLVTHDEALGQASTTERWVIRGGRLRCGDQGMEQKSGKISGSPPA